MWYQLLYNVIHYCRICFFRKSACVFWSQLAKVDLHFANQICFSMLLGWPHEIGPSSVDAYGLHVDTLTNAERK